MNDHPQLAALHPPYASSQRAIKGGDWPGKSDKQTRGGTSNKKPLTPSSLVDIEQRGFSMPAAKGQHRDKVGVWSQRGSFANREEGGDLLTPNVHSTTSSREEKEEAADILLLYRSRGSVARPQYLVELCSTRRPCIGFVKVVVRRDDDGNRRRLQGSSNSSNLLQLGVLLLKSSSAMVMVSSYPPIAPGEVFVYIFRGAQRFIGGENCILLHQRHTGLDDQIGTDRCCADGE